MKNLITTSFKDLMNGHPSAQIHCAMTGTLVRTLTKMVEQGIPMVHIVAGDGTELMVDMETPIHYEPWCFDRGSLDFNYQGQSLKICTELDTITFPNGDTFSVTPLPQVSLGGRSELN